MPSAGILSSARGTGFKSALGNGASNTSNTTCTMTTTAPIAVGDLVVVRWAADNLNASTPTGSSCSDGSANSYSNRSNLAVNATAAAGVAGGIFACLATVAVATGATITLTLSGAVTQKAMYAESFVGFQNALRATASTGSGASTAASVTTTGSATVGDLVIGAIAIESRTAPSAYDTDTSSGSWSAGVVKPSNTTGTDNTLVEIVGQHKIVTATATQTFNLTNTSTDWVAIAAIFMPS